MLSNQKEFPVDEELAGYFDAYHAALELRDKAIRLPFGYRKAYKAAKDAVKNQRKFWKKVYKVFPEVAEKPFEYYRLEQVLREKPTDNE